jgi:hypothetical protein
MRDLIEQLVQEEREGEWWDFKLKHHNNLSDLLHDVLCMANILYKGDRYIIFGVSDDYKMVGINADDKRNTQADILDYFRKMRFANYNIPSMELSSHKLGGVEIDLLTISDSKNKPYFITEDVKSGKSTVRSGVIYSRLGDTNTPKDRCANPYEIEAMWRERFGLDDKASDRFMKILLDFNNWQYDGVDSAFYDIDPDFTIVIGDSESDGGKFWWEEGLTERATKYYYHLKYKKVELHKVPVVRFRNENLCIPFPSIEYITYPRKKDGCKTDIYCDLFYFQKNTIEYSLFKHIRALEVESPTKRSFSTPIETQIKPPIIKLPFIFIEDELQLKAFCNELVSNFDNFLAELKSSSNVSNIEDDVRKRVASERLFSEWAFKVAYDKCL